MANPRFCLPFKYIWPGYKINVQNKSMFSIYTYEKEIKIHPSNFTLLERVENIIREKQELSIIKGIKWSIVANTFDIGK